MSKKVAVVGAGIAGVAAAWALSRAGLEVHCLSDETGETLLSSGAFDDCPWALGATEAEVALGKSFVDELGVFTLGEAEFWVATSEGILRPVAAAAEGIMKVSDYAGQTIGVVDIGRPSFDARWLARSWGEQDWARGTGTRFVPVPLRGAFEDVELRLPQAAFARLVENELRVARLEEVLRSQLEDGSIRALLGGPWLGADLSCGPARRLTQSPVPLLETLHGPEGPMGDRFLSARNRLFSQNFISFRKERVLEIETLGTEVRLSTEKADQCLNFSAVICCMGGLLGGGEEFVPVHQGQLRGFRLSSSEGSGGQLGGWDPAYRPERWLGSSSAQLPVVMNNGIIRVDTGPAGAGSMGRAAEAGLRAAHLLLEYQSRAH